MINVHSFTFNPAQENTYLLSNESGQTIIIDPGCYFSAEEERLKHHITQHGLMPVQLINTHCHLDHVFGDRWAAKTYRLEPYIHPKEEQILQLAPAMSINFGMPFDGYKGPLQFLDEGDKIMLGDDELQAILAPGHSPGSLCFYCEAQHFLIGGDVLFYESIGRTDLPFGDHEQLLHSIKDRLFLLPDDTVVHPGHGPTTTIGHEKKYNPYLR